MKRFGWLLWMLIAGLVPACEAQTGAVNGYCQNGGAKVSSSGITSTTTVQQSFPSCNVYVYLTGTTTIATIYADKNATPLNNPFTASPTGKFLFYAAGNAGLDVTVTGGTPPNTLGAPVTLYTNIFPSVPNGGGGVTQILAGSNVTISPTGGVGAVTVNASGGGSSLQLQTNGVNNGSQTLLNLVSGSNISVSNSAGNTTISGPSCINNSFADYICSDPTVSQGISQPPGTVIGLVSQDNDGGFPAAGAGITVGNRLISMQGYLDWPARSVAISAPTFQIGVDDLTGVTTNYGSFYELDASSNNITLSLPTPLGFLDGSTRMFILSRDDATPSGHGVTVLGGSGFSYFLPNGGSVIVAEYTGAGGGTFWKNVSNNSIQAISTIASASTISPTTSIIHITGTSPISTITPPPGFTSISGNCIDVIADAVWTTTNSGNIASAPITSVANSPYRTCWGGSSWYIK